MIKTKLIKYFSILIHHESGCVLPYPQEKLFSEDSILNTPDGALLVIYKENLTAKECNLEIIKIAKKLKYDFDEIELY